MIVIIMHSLPYNSWPGFGPIVITTLVKSTFEKLFSGLEVGRRVRKISVRKKTVYEIEPWTHWKEKQ